MNILIIVIILLCVLISGLWSMQQRFSGLYSLAAAGLGAYCLVVTLGVAAGFLLEPRTVFTELPVPAGLTLLFMVSGWEIVFRAHNTTFLMAKRHRLWMGVILLLPIAVAGMLLREVSALSLYASAVLLLQSAMFLRLLLRTDARAGFLVLTAAAVLVSECLLLLAYIPETASAAVLVFSPFVLAPLLFLFGLGRYKKYKGVNHG